MAKLIQLRQRIKAIETIKKITHAMRLISMSAHSQLKREQQPFSQYMHILENIFSKVRAYNPSWHNAIIYPKDKIPHKELVIIIGSQKGLCGSFNNHLFKLYEKKASTIKSADYIIIGQKAVDYFRRSLKKDLIRHTYEKFTYQRILSIAQEITHTILHSRIHYSKVSVFSNTFKSFFLQKPQRTNLIPIDAISEKNQLDASDMLWEQSPNELLDILVHQYLESRMRALLFESLLSEHAARFISMDSATRNANSLLEKTRLDYNKLRQAKITKELTELTSSYKDQ